MSMILRAKYRNVSLITLHQSDQSFYSIHCNLSKGCSSQPQQINYRPESAFFFFALRSDSDLAQVFLLPCTVSTAFILEFLFPPMFCPSLMIYSWVWIQSICSSHQQAYYHTAKIPCVPHSPNGFHPVASGFSFFFLQGVILKPPMCYFVEVNQTGESVANSHFNSCAWFSAERFNNWAKKCLSITCLLQTLPAHVL